MFSEQQRQEEQRDSAEQVIDAEKFSRVHAVGEPTRSDGADHVEGFRSTPTGTRPSWIGIPWSCDAGNEVRADQAVGARAADREGTGEKPEHLGLRRHHQHRDRPASGAAALVDRLGGWGRNRRARRTASYPRLTDSYARNSRTNGTTASAANETVKATLFQSYVSAIFARTGRNTS